MRPQSALKLFAVLAALLCLFIVVRAGAQWAQSPISGRDVLEEIRAREAAEKGAVDQLLQDWLTSQERGEDGLKFWANKSCVHPISLYTVMDYKVVDDRSSFERVVRIHSTTKGGSPIVQLWRITIFDGKINMVEPAKKD